MIYIWRIPNNFPNVKIGTYDRDISPDRFLFTKGIRANMTIKPTIKFSVKMSEINELDVLPNDALLPIVNDKTLDILNKFANQDFESIPVNISALDGNVSSYSLINILSKVNALDLNNSTYNYVPGTKAILGFSKLKFLVKGIGYYNLSRDVDFFPFILVSSMLQKELILGNLNGIWLASPEEIFD